MISQAAIQHLEQQLASLKRMAQPAQQSPASTAIGSQQELLLSMYDEFCSTDDGKALAANLQKFSRYVQGRVDKTTSSSI